MLDVDLPPRELSVKDVYDGSPIPEGETRIVANVGDTIHFGNRTFGLVTAVDPVSLTYSWIDVSKASSNFHEADMEVRFQKTKKKKPPHKPEPRRVILKTVKSRRDAVHKVCRTQDQGNFAIFPD